jgi:photosystem II stability/assembly factor-like uncharacterized protein
MDARAKDASVIHALSYGRYYRSADGGSNWTSTSLPFEISYSGKLCVHPTEPDTVYVYGSRYDWEEQTYPFFLAVSRNRGQSWTSATWPAISMGQPQGMAVCKSNPQVLYACGYTYNPSSRGVLYKSTNGGATWSDLSTSAITAAGNYQYSVAVDPSDPNKVFVGGDIFVSSSDGGLTWKPGLTAMTYVYSIMPDPANAGTFYAANSSGVFVSTDSGGSWRKRSSVGGSVSQLSLAEQYPTLLFLAFDTGLYRSTNSGMSWSSVVQGIPNSNISALSVCPSSPTTLYAEYKGRALFKSVDGGLNWSEKRPSTLTNCGYLADVLVRRDNPTVAFALEESG